MKVEFRKRFLKELSKIPPSVRQEIENFVFIKTSSLKTIFEISKIEKMKGYPNYYKVRFGSYRVGLKLEDDTINFERVLHRKDIYRYFP